MVFDRAPSTEILCLWFDRKNLIQLWLLLRLLCMLVNSRVIQGRWALTLVVSARYVIANQSNQSFVNESPVCVYVV